MRFLTFVSLAFAAGCQSICAQTVTLDAIQDGKKVGTVSFTRTISGAKQSSVTKLTTLQNGVTTTLDLRASFESKGVALSRSASIKQGKNSANLSATFSGRNASVVIDSNGKKVTRVIPAPEGQLGDPTMWWFVRDKPKVGTKVTYLTFNIVKLTWTSVSATYVGKKSIMVGTKKVSANQVSESRDGGTFNAYLDDKGLPLILEQPKVRFVRKW
ncbi:MAG: hypothetical protein BGO01_01535 [Armatimonadetes bacterium 55-13]|nr:hypothetical protein [Armatimonadota bacterium]OJU65628.1 MAG: hypothetical protein BGO01_01535 [Armatimonadetes bacterium 55-13]